MAAAAAAAKKAVKFTSHWRIAGLGYLEQLSAASTALARVLKEPARSEALGKTQYRYREFVFAGGKEGAPGASLQRPVPSAPVHSPASRGHARYCSPLRIPRPQSRLSPTPA